ncbi:MAG: LD-carboxypeptidase [Polyangiales bacterium]
MTRALVPHFLRPGDLVAIVAPSSPFDVERYRLGEGFLKARYGLRVRDDLLARSGYLAGDDDRRRAELEDALADPDVRAIVAARGGFGATRLVDRIDFGVLARSPKWLVGFSDVTALHVEASRVGVASLHAPMVASLGSGDDEMRTAFVRALEGEARDRSWAGLDAWTPGTARGPAFGGNLALLESCAAAGRLVVPPGAVVFLEDCTERPYRVDRMLTALHLGGHLARAAAFVVGDFTDCAPGPDGVDVMTVLRARLSGYRVPVVAGAPFGHGARNEPFVLGASVEVVADGNGGAVRFSDSAASATRSSDCS